MQFPKTLILTIFGMLTCYGQSDTPSEELTIRVTTVPPRDTGGPDKLGKIAGTVTGRCASCRLILFAKGGDIWYVQPWADSPFTEVLANGKWESETHLGLEYGVVLAEASYLPPSQTDSLPSVKGEVRAVVTVGGIELQGSQTREVLAEAPVERWRLIWSDEFDGPSDSAPDPMKWVHDLGNNNGWGNQELEAYTNSIDNARLDGHGHLVIQTSFDGERYTSARLKTEGKFSLQYGKVEARIKMPGGHGIWPAFWMLGDNVHGVGWPLCGEIDIMENSGKEPSSIHGSLHGPGYSGGRPIGSTYALPNGKMLADEFHVFAVTWSAEEISLSVDGTAYFAARPVSLSDHQRWVFDHPFFLILNIAVGGNFPGAPDSTTQFPQRMLVDYVRVYKPISEVR